MEKEIEKSCPALTAAVYHGTSRGDFADAYANHQVILTSYGLLVNDLEMMKELEYEYVILDESQAIKNPSSQRYKAAKLESWQQNSAHRHTHREQYF